MMDDGKWTTVIADDHPVFRRGLVDVLTSDGTCQVVAEVGNGMAALEALEHWKPDVLILDIDMPGMNGLDVMKELRKRKLRVAIVVLTMYEEERMFNKVLDLGAAGYVLKESAVTDIRESIRAVAAGKHYISPSISGYLVHRSRGTMPALQSQPGIGDLTPSERRIVKLISENKTSKEIAGELSISVNTVENHRGNICRKLGITGNNALLRFALENKALL
jgi:DNA-binding NarL/FixJ family response regulator